MVDALPRCQLLRLNRSAKCRTMSPCDGIRTTFGPLRLPMLCSLCMGERMDPLLGKPTLLRAYPTGSGDRWGLNPFLKAHNLECYRLHHSHNKSEGLSTLALMVYTGGWELHTHTPSHISVFLLP